MIVVSVIIPTYKDWPRLKLCLDALCKQTYPQDQFEVIVVNNDPDDSCPFELPANNMKIIEEAKPGSYAARNAGIKIAKGEILAFTDSDCIPDERWISNTIELFQIGSYDRVAGNISIFKTEHTTNFTFLYQKYFSMKQNDYVKQHSSALTANLLVKKEAFTKAGMFREDLYSGGDYEWGVRASKNGLSIIYEPNAIIYHPSRESFSEILKKKRRTVGGSYQIKYKNYSLFRIFLVFVAQLIPPIVQLRKTAKAEGLKVRFVLFIMLWLNNLVGLTELLKLIFLKSRLRRQ